MVESELGNSIHEERIIAQRDVKPYKGYIPINVEFLLEYLFAVGFSPAVKIGDVPIKLWGRYLPDTLVMYIRQLYKLPQHDLFYLSLLTLCCKRSSKCLASFTRTLFQPERMTQSTSCSPKVISVLRTSMESRF